MFEGMEGNSVMSPVRILLVVALLLFAGFLAGSESALNSISRVWVEDLGDRKPKLAQRLSKILAQPAKYTNVMLLVRKAAELSATVFVAQSILTPDGNLLVRMVLVIGIMVVLSYVVVGVGPRTLGKQHAMKWAPAATIVADLLARTLGPLTRLLIAIGNALTPGRGFKQGPFTSEAELRDLVDQASERGRVEES
jgi:CBS domain containing-hemolysin-like protein